MILEDIYYVSQIIAAIAIVASLVFVGLQLRQADKTKRAEMHQARADRIIGIFNQQAQPHVVTLMARLSTVSENLSSEEFMILRTLIMTMVLNLEDQVWQQRAGLLDAATVNRTRHNSRMFFALPAIRTAFQLLRPTLFPEQVEAIDRELIHNQPLLSEMDFRVVWQKTFAEVKATAVS